MDIVALPRAPIGLAMGWTLLVNSVSESLAPAWENLPAEQNHPLCKRLGHPKPPAGSFARILAIPKPPAGPVSERSAFRERLAVDSSLFASWSLVSQHQGEGRRHSFIFDTGLFASWSLVSQHQGEGRRLSFIFDTGLFASWSLVSQHQGEGVVVCPAA